MGREQCECAATVLHQAQRRAGPADLFAEQSLAGMRRGQHAQVPHGRTGRGARAEHAVARTSHRLAGCAVCSRDPCKSSPAWPFPGEARVGHGTYLGDAERPRAGSSSAPHSVGCATLSSWGAAVLEQVQCGAKQHSVALSKLLVQPPRLAFAWGKWVLLLRTLSQRVLCLGARVYRRVGVAS